MYNIHKHMKERTWRSLLSLLWDNDDDSRQQTSALFSSDKTQRGLFKKNTLDIYDATRRSLPRGSAQKPKEEVIKRQLVTTRTIMFYIGKQRGEGTLVPVIRQPFSVPIATIIRLRVLNATRATLQINDTLVFHAFLNGDNKIGISIKELLLRNLLQDEIEQLYRI